jgi:ATP-dependent DNA ligase
MASRVPGLAELPPGLVLDGELVAYDEQGPTSRRGDIVAKRRDRIYRSGYRGWMKVKNPSYWRRESEIELMHRPRERVVAAWR